ncbi:maleylpyruvate isomerase family mycothiol-dependent enzyme [Rhodococcus globerulus]|uniref:Maleylpyruvate isomerase family mycothiol-dependent enzyme n=1 Tax=Rhodococcus globerulus TaxID=33008 RepID=A0ABU4C3C6_RHOGO|nr:maleylpyruvate isomerase family mycothiol-dependent enzyme [Rhodococcus globerulus]MDV6271006.1 maleylpyruvate isomerase family mycothiol-dependent enzyme [Rhodococcus globerulus]
MIFHDLTLVERLDATRRGTELFARHLAELGDDEFAQPSGLPDWTRAHLVAHVGYNAAALSRLTDWAATGIETPMYDSVEQRGREIDEGATESVQDLRDRFEHTARLLDDKWLSLPKSFWSNEVRTIQGRTVPASETVWLRAREVWIHAVDLGNGAEFSDIPEPVLRSLVDDVVKAWRTRGVGSELALDISDEQSLVVGDEHLISVSGDLPSIVQWVAGRGSSGVSGVPVGLIAPRWL